MIKLVLLDVDGTIYPLEGGFTCSELAMQVEKNARAFLVDQVGIAEDDVTDVLTSIREEFGENLSIAMEQKFGKSRKEFFDSVWDIDPSQIISRDDAIYGTIATIAAQFKIVVVSDAPLIWVRRVLMHLGVYELIASIETGEGELRKSNGKIFPHIIKKYGIAATEAVMVGDQEHSDVLPPKKLGIRTVFVGGESQVADACCKDISSLPEVIRSLEVQI